MNFFFFKIKILYWFKTREWFLSTFASADLSWKLKSYCSLLLFTFTIHYAFSVYLRGDVSYVKTWEWFRHFRQQKVTKWIFFFFFSKLKFCIDLKHKNGFSNGFDFWSCAISCLLLFYPSNYVFISGISYGLINTQKYFQASWYYWIWNSHSFRERACYMPTSFPDRTYQSPLLELMIKNGRNGTILKICFPTSKERLGVIYIYIYIYRSYFDPRPAFSLSSYNP